MHAMLAFKTLILITLLNHVAQIAAWGLTSLRFRTEEPNFYHELAGSHQSSDLPPKVLEKLGMLQLSRMRDIKLKTAKLKEWVREAARNPGSRNPKLEIQMLSQARKIKIRVDRLVAFYGCSDDRHSDQCYYLPESQALVDNILKIITHHTTYSENQETKLFRAELQLSQLEVLGGGRDALQRSWQLLESGFTEEKLVDVLIQVDELHQHALDFEIDLDCPHGASRGQCTLMEEMKGDIASIRKKLVMDQIPFFRYSS